MSTPVIDTPVIQMLPDGRMDTTNASKYLGLSIKTLAMMRSVNKGPEFTKRGRVFYFKEDLDVWLAAGRASSTAACRNLHLIED